MNKIDHIMEKASELLAKTQYLQCEKLCLQALALAKADDDYDRLSRILMPLQEARRLRRQIACDAGVFIFSGHHRSPKEILANHSTGCLLLTDPPYTAKDETDLRQLALETECYIEVLLLDQHSLQAAYLKAMEDRGDAILATLSDNLTDAQQIDVMLKQLDHIGDHEIAHQRLASIARKIMHQST